MDTKQIIELAEKLSDLPVKEVKWGGMHLVFDREPEQPTLEDFPDELESATEPTDDDIKFWSAQ